MEKPGPYIHDFQKQRQSPQRWARKGQILLSDCSFLVYVIPLPIGNPLYSNVLFQPRGPQRRDIACGGKGARHPQGGPERPELLFALLPPALHSPTHLAPKPCPSPSGSISTVRISPDPGSSEQSRPRGFLEVGRVKTPETQRGHPAQWPRKDITESRHARESSSPS